MDGETEVKDSRGLTLRTAAFKALCVAFCVLHTGRVGAIPIAEFPRCEQRHTGYLAGQQVPFNQSLSNALAIECFSVVFWDEMPHCTAAESAEAKLRVTNDKGTEYIHLRGQTLSGGSLSNILIKAGLHQNFPIVLEAPTSSFDCPVRYQMSVTARVEALTSHVTVMVVMASPQVVIAEKPMELVLHVAGAKRVPSVFFDSGTRMCSKGSGESQVARTRPLTLVGQDYFAATHTFKVGGLYEVCVDDGSATDRMATLMVVGPDTLFYNFTCSGVDNVILAGKDCVVNVFGSGLRLLDTGGDEFKLVPEKSDCATGDALQDTAVKLLGDKETQDAHQATAKIVVPAESGKNPVFCYKMAATGRWVSPVFASKINRDVRLAIVGRSTLSTDVASAESTATEIRSLTTPIVSSTGRPSSAGVVVTCGLVSVAIVGVGALCYFLKPWRHLRSRGWFAGLASGSYSEAPEENEANEGDTLVGN